MLRLASARKGWFVLPLGSLPPDPVHLIYSMPFSSPNYPGGFHERQRDSSEYLALVQSEQLCYAESWLPHLKKNLAGLGKKQQRAARMIKGLEHLPYQGRRKLLGLFSLEEKKVTGG